VHDVAAFQRLCNSIGRPLLAGRPSSGSLLGVIRPYGKRFPKPSPSNQKCAGSLLNAWRLCGSRIVETDPSHQK
jgi:hypothetical protein